MQLLVSVRNASEAIVAAQSGADIIDVKEPAQGALGFAGWNVIRSVAQAVGGNVVVSAALGEYSEWTVDNDDRQKSDVFIADLQFVKLGLAGSMNVAVKNNLPPWDSEWKLARQKVEGCPGLNGVPLSWVAVAYADAETACSPTPACVLAAAVAAGCCILLIDTYSKNGKTTLDWLSESELITLRSAANDAGLRFALAGQLTQKHLASIERIRPDIFAVRGAVCESDRSSSIDANKVKSLKQNLNAFA